VLALQRYVLAREAEKDRLEETEFGITMDGCHRTTGDYSYKPPSAAAGQTAEDPDS
jgi:ERCC4-related helicase